MNQYILKVIGAFAISFICASCQQVDRPELGDYATDSNPPGGPLKFYAAFDGTTSNPLMNAVDSIQAKFPVDNPLKTIDGPGSKAVQGEKYKYIKYSSPNDFASTAGSFTIAFWVKKGELKTEHIFSLPSPAAYHWSAATMFVLTEGTIEKPAVKFFVKDKTDEKWFEWVDANAVTGLYDNNWHHLAFVYESTTSVMTLYKDAQPQSNKPEWTNHGKIMLDKNNITGLKIGAGPQEFSADEIKNGADDWLKNSWTGGIDQFRMYASALSAAEIQNLYTKKK